MATLKESAEAYETPIRNNISELQLVSVDVEIKEKKFKEGTKEEYTTKYIEQEGKKYRVPDTVLQGLKDMLKQKPGAKMFQVVKTGQDLETKYNVVCLE